MKLGQLLLQVNLVTPGQLQEALEEQRSRGGLLGAILVGQGYVSEGALVAILARQYGIPTVDLGAFPPDPGLASRFFREVPRSRAAKLRIAQPVAPDAS